MYVSVHQCVNVVLLNITSLIVTHYWILKRYCLEIFGLDPEIYLLWHTCVPPSRAFRSLGLIISRPDNFSAYEHCQFFNFG